MGAETAQLQRLTDEQVNARLSAYNSDGSLDRDIALLRDKAGDLIETHVRDQFGKEAAEHASVHYSSRVDAGWIQNIAEYGRRIFQDQASVPSYIAARGRLKSAIVDDMFDRFADDTDTRCVPAPDDDRDRHHSRAGCLARGHRRRRCARPRERPV